MLSFDKKDVKENLTIDNIYELCEEWGGEPEYCSTGLIIRTICHNRPFEGSKKLYYYENSGLFRCYTGCDSTFDIFELTIKVMKNQFNIEFDLNQAVHMIASKFGISGIPIDELEVKMADWNIFKNYTRIEAIEQSSQQNIILKEYDKSILNKLNYDVIIKPWINEGISVESMRRAVIGFYPGGSQITIPHYDQNNRFIGLRGRTLSTQDAERFGKYRPLLINKQLYTHPLGMNLYNLNKSKQNIKQMEKAIIFESEKSTLQYQSAFGFENDISVACCGSTISTYQIKMLLDNGAKEIIIAFDRQFQEIGDKEFKHLTTNLKKINERYKNYINISFIFDKNKITSYKASPIDEGKDKFLTLFKERIIL